MIDSLVVMIDDDDSGDDISDVPGGDVAATADSNDAGYEIKDDGGKDGCDNAADAGDTDAASSVKLLVMLAMKFSLYY